VRRGLYALPLLLLLAAPVPGAAAITRNEEPATPPADKLTGQLLVATPELDDPHFRHAVVLVVHHGQDGTLGLVVNRPLGKAPAVELLKRLGVPEQGVKGDIELSYGGPVQPEIGMVVHSTDYRLPDTTSVTRQLSVTSNPQVLHDMAAGSGPQHAVAVLGYAGWGPGQLEGEMAGGAWFTIPADPDLVFTPDPDKEWQTAVGRRGEEL
jgi:putative transcriptional regulator